MYCPNRKCPDFERTGEPGEYVEGVTTCPYCGSALVAELPDMTDDDYDDHNDNRHDHRYEEGLLPVLEDEPEPVTRVVDRTLVEVARYDSHEDAEPMVSFLVDQNINAFEWMDDEGRIDPEKPDAPVRLLVPRGQSTLACALIAEMEGGGCPDPS